MSRAGQSFDFDAEIDRRKTPALKVHPHVVGPWQEGLFAAGVADMDFCAPAVVREALARRLAHGVFGYEAVPDGLIPALCNWLAEEHGWQVPASHVLRAPNILNALAMAVNLFSEKGDGVIVQPPVFFDFFDVIRENGRRVVSNPLLLEGGRYHMDFAGLARLAAEPRTRLLFLCNPHNPVGRVWSRSELETLGAICAEHGVLVVSDEIHGDLAYAAHPYTPFAALGEAFAQNAISCLSPAKSFNIASCCTAFTVIADEARRAAFAAENSRLTVNKNNAFANVAMEAAYREGGPWLAAVRAYIEENAALVAARIAELAGVDLITPEGTFLLWLDFRQTGLADEALRSFLREKARWAVIRGEAFGEGGRGFARINIACPRARLERALAQLAHAMATL